MGKNYARAYDVEFPDTLQAGETFGTGTDRMMRGWEAWRCGGAVGCLLAGGLCLGFAAFTAGDGVPVHEFLYLRDVSGSVARFDGPFHREVNAAWRDALSAGATKRERVDFAALAWRAVDDNDENPIPHPGPPHPDTAAHPGTDGPDGGASSVTVRRGAPREGDAAERESGLVPLWTSPHDGAGSDPAAAWAFAARPPARRVRRRVWIETDGRAVPSTRAEDARRATEALRGRAELWIRPVGVRPAGDGAVVSASAPARARAGADIAVVWTWRSDRAGRVRWTWHDTSALPDGSAPVDAGVRVRGVVDAPVGESVWRIRVPVPSTPGPRRMLLSAVADGADAPPDPCPENNAFPLWMEVSARGRVFWMAGRASASPDAVSSSDASASRDAARADDRSGTETWIPVPPSWWTPHSHPAPPDDFLAPGSVLILDNVPRHDLPPDAPARLARAVESGLGLLVLGGPRALGPGGYDREDEASGGVTLASLLPARMTPRAPVDVVFAVDASGSMGQADTAGRSRLSWAAAAVRAAWTRLREGDRAGLVLFRNRPEMVSPPTPVIPSMPITPTPPAASFDTAADVIAPDGTSASIDDNAAKTGGVTTAPWTTNPTATAARSTDEKGRGREGGEEAERARLPMAVRRVLTEVRPGGGTRLWPAVATAAIALSADDARPARRLVVALTDGDEGDPPAPEAPERPAYDDAVRRLQDGQIRLVILRVATDAPFSTTPSDDGPVFPHSPSVSGVSSRPSSAASFLMTPTDIDAPPLSPSGDGEGARPSSSTVHAAPSSTPAIDETPDIRRPPSGPDGQGEAAAPVADDAPDIHRYTIGPDGQGWTAALDGAVRAHRDYGRVDGRVRFYARTHPSFPGSGLGVDLPLDAEFNAAPDAGQAEQKAGRDEIGRAHV